MTFEVCIDSLASAKAAQEGGAQRVELCDNLIEGGTTPSFGMVKVVCQHTSLAVMVMIRPRGGDFLYNEEELEIMAEDIQHFKQLPIKGFVFGLLKKDGTIDIENAKKLIALSRPFEVAFHRAFDMSLNPSEALETLIDLGVDRLLTSGQKLNAFEGRMLLKQLHQQAAGRITIMPGAGINEENIQEIIRMTGASEFHASAKASISSQMDFQNQAVSMSDGKNSAFNLFVTSKERVKAIFENAKKAHL